METWFWILGWFLSILTITGNGFIIFLVCNKRQLRTKPNAFIVSLAVADFCVGISVVPLLFLYEMTSDRSYSQGLHIWVLFIRWLFQDASVVNLCSLALDRYIAVAKPYKYVTFMTHNRVAQMIFFSWTITFILIFLEASLWLSLKSLVILKVFIWLVIIFFEFLPCCMMMLCLISMLRVVYRQHRTSIILAGQLRFNHRVLYKPHEKSAVVTMIIVVAFFLVCYGLYLDCSFVLVLNDEKCTGNIYRVPLLILNSAANPVAYGFFKRDIKTEFKKLICILTWKKDNKVRHLNDNNRVTVASSTS